MVVAKINSDSKDEKKVNLLKSSWKPTPSQLPPRVVPKGLSPQRQWYLYDKIREFCPEEDREITCPMPTVPREGEATSRAGTPAGENPASDEEDRDDAALLPPQKKRRCRTCNREGHNSRTCPDKKQ